MSVLRDVARRFFYLRLSQCRAVAESLDLYDAAETHLPDFEWRKGLLLRARDRGLLDALEQAIAEQEEMRHDR